MDQHYGATPDDWDHDVTDTDHGPAGDDWERDDDRIRREVTTDSYPAAIALVVRLGMLFEEHGHHADLALSWTRLTIELTSHDTGGVTDRDHAMAHRIDELLTAVLG